MELARRLFTFALLGVVLGAAAASLLAPGYLDYYNIPGAESPQCNCTERTRNTASSLLSGQTTGAIIGGVALLIGGIVLAVRRRRTEGTPPSASTSATSGAPPVPPSSSGMPPGP
jgi:LPXTG-motif cell wall-anchored protein